MSTFDHIGLIQGINESLATFRKAQPEAMRGFAQLAQASMAEGALTSKHKELIALAIGVTQRCSGCIGFHVKALQKLGATRAELEEMLTVCVYMGRSGTHVYSRSPQGLGHHGQRQRPSRSRSRSLTPQSRHPSAALARSIPRRAIRQTGGDKSVYILGIYPRDCYQNRRGCPCNLIVVMG